MSIFTNANVKVNYIEKKFLTCLEKVKLWLDFVCIAPKRKQQNQNKCS